MKKELTLGRLVELLEYDPLTGLFFWKVTYPGSRYEGDIAGYRHDKNGYIAIKIDGARYLAHRLAWFISYGTWPKQEIDHMNGVPYDNRLENLRDVSRSVNARNSDRCDEGYHGVTPSGLKWKVMIKVDGKVRHFGTFQDKEEAAAYAQEIIKKRDLK